MLDTAGWTDDAVTADVMVDALTARLAVGLTHDLKNYLLGIVGFTELASDTLAAEHPARAHLRSVDALATAATDAVTRLLAITQAGGEAARVYDLAARLRTVLQTLDRATPHRVRLECEIPDSFPALALPALVDQAVANLVLNAADALPAGGGTVRVRLSSQRSDDGGAAVVLEVTDDGPGIAPAVAPRLFERGVCTKGNGCGLGLSLVRAIATAHGGHVEVDSAAGRGSSFRIIVPLRGVSEPAEQPLTS